MYFLPIYFFSYTHFACLSFLVIITVVFMNFSLSFFGLHVAVWCIHHFLLQCAQSPTVNYSDLITVVENQDCVPPRVADGSKAQNIFGFWGRQRGAQHQPLLQPHWILAGRAGFQRQRRQSTRHLPLLLPWLSTQSDLTFWLLDLAAIVIKSAFPVNVS